MYMHMYMYSLNACELIISLWMIAKYLICTKLIFTFYQVQISQKSRDSITEIARNKWKLSKQYECRTCI